ncbi:MAG: 4-hydroxy-3-methylbut-2-enyl diphosphate reductase, partial [Deltaproteobacteria bacterium]|nr:4-hydroxy-3-methylbut-2-enyl diphosphate reductase [Deltaproteobacteria bacterium]
ELFGAPIFVRHEIVHNRHVVDDLRKKGVVFVEELDEVPDNAVVIFSAHGVSRGVMAEGEKRKLRVVDATCPLVTKVHTEARRHAAEGREQILIGHAGHPEVEGTMGQVNGGMHLVSSVSDVESLSVEKPGHIAFVTQTTLSVDESAEIVSALRKRFPKIRGPGQENACYATQNRQRAVKEMVRDIDALLVVGALNSSNSNRLRELGERCGVPSYLVSSAADIRPEWLAGITRVGVTAGASAPEYLVREVLCRLRSNNGELAINEVSVTRENVQFSLPI